MPCLVLGGAGFLGSHLTARLVQGGRAVRVYDRSCASPRKAGDLPAAVELVPRRLADTAALAEALRDVDVVFHLIGPAEPGGPGAGLARARAPGVLPTLRLLDLARRHHVRRIVYVSSGGTVYGVPRVLPIPEEHPTVPISARGARALAIERCLERYRRRHGLDGVVLRVANAFGERQRTDRGQGVVAAFLDRLARGEPLEIWGDGTVVRDFVYAGDVADAAVRAAEYGGEERVFNVGSGTGLSVARVAELVQHAAGTSAALRFLPARRRDVGANVLDIRRARRCLGWAPAVSFGEGLGRVLAHRRGDGGHELATRAVLG